MLVGRHGCRYARNMQQNGATFESPGDQVYIVGETVLYIVGETVFSCLVCLFFFVGGSGLSGLDFPPKRRKHL
jgi:hypothetical protein